jgi:hypothetical protein
MQMSDDKNPDFIFQLTHTELLVKAVNGEIDLKALAEAELQNRGLDHSGRWVGFEAAKRRVAGPLDEPDEE